MGKETARWRGRWAILLILFGIASLQGEWARAFPGEPMDAVTDSAQRWPLMLVRRPLVLGPGMLELRSTGFYDLSEDGAGEPFSLAPSLAYGVNRQLTVALVTGRGFCLSGDAVGCSTVLADLGLQALYALGQQGGSQLALKVSLAAGTPDVVQRGFLLQQGFDPFTSSLELGVAFKAQVFNMALVAAPALSIGLSGRDGEPGNGEFLILPVELQLQLLPRLAAFASLALNGPLDYSRVAFQDAFAIPFAAGLQLSLLRTLDLGLRCAYPNLLGANDFAGAPERTAIRYLFFDVAWRH